MYALLEQLSLEDACPLAALCDVLQVSDHGLIRAAESLRPADGVFR